MFKNNKTKPNQKMKKNKIKKNRHFTHPQIVFFKKQMNALEEQVTEIKIAVH